MGGSPRFEPHLFSDLVTLDEGDHHNGLPIVLYHICLCDDDGSVDEGRLPFDGLDRFVRHPLTFVDLESLELGDVGRHVYDHARVVLIGVLREGEDLADL